MSDNLKFYLDTIQRELERLEQGKFTGNVEFRPNFKDGKIANMNIILAKSVRQIE